MNRLLVAAPWITILALIGLSVALPNQTRASEQTEQRKAEIARAIKAVPRLMGRWVGEDQDEGESKVAQRLLKPNAILNRRYTCPGSPWVHVLVVHCGDSRDMNNHYPPVCYPSDGWMAVDASPNPDRVLIVEGRQFPVREYGFKSYLVDGREDVIRVFGAFILPDGTMTREIDDISRQSERLSVAVQGVAQMQIITSGRVSVADAMSAAEEVLSGMTMLFDALHVERGPDRAPGGVAGMTEADQGASS